MRSIDGLQSADGVGTDSVVDEVETTPTSVAGAVTARRRLAAASWFVGAVLVTTFFAIGAWQRRWIADDGLIVLRTLRNLFAGNGPVFNAGERVEANTSTAWTYLLWFWAWVTDAQLEYVALWVALVCSVAAIPIAMYGAARLYGNRIGGLTGDGWTLLLPFTAVVYIALPPARDFATSGLESGLCIFWVAVLWVQLVAWARRGPRSGGRAATATLLLAFTAGLAPLIRPELAVLGGLVLLLVFFAPLGWKMRLGVLVVAGALPVGYQIFRMGYYGLLVPNPAVAKDASGSKWEQGFAYLTNLFGPYVLLLPVILAVIAGVLLIVGGRLRAAPADATDTAADPQAPAGSRFARFSARLQTTPVAVAVVVAAGLILVVYWVRQGGDFMHGRVLLTPLFITFLPLMVVPVTIPAHVKAAFARRDTDPAARRRAGLGLAGSVAMAGMWITVLVWAITTHSTVLPNAGIDIGRSGIVDERRFYVTNMGNENPVTAEDYLDYPRMKAMVEKIEQYRDQGGVILPSFNYDEWYVAKLPGEMPPGAKRQVTVYFLNLGMTSMNAPLDVRVIDQMGLAYPLAAHTERLEDGRIGHDKILPSEWVIAESGAFPRRPVLPGYLDEDLVRQAQVALQCPETKDRFASFEGPWSFSRFKHNLRQAFTFNSYRIQREPEYEILRCGLEMPPPVNPGN
ncbi:flagellar motor control protein ZomB [Gordonia paraffinivorans]|uniref:flagellar motor control protein ZomB n=1 Tax=Gordonia paraffinivorans TaxID=175628 RepID=UPI003FCDD87F